MEKYARQALSEGIKSDTELHVSEESELYRVLNVHYNRNNHIEVSVTLCFHFIRLEVEELCYEEVFISPQGESSSTLL